MLFSGHRGAEALLRIPDDCTQKALIRDKMSAANWDSPLGHSEPVIREAVNQAMRIVGRQFVMGGPSKRPLTGPIRWSV